MADWSNLPEELLNFIAVRLFSVVEHKRFRSICKPWRSSVSDAGNNTLFPSQPLMHLLNPYPNPTLTQRKNHIKRGEFLSRAAFFRVTLSSSSSQGWLMKFNVDINSGKTCLLEPLSRHALRHSSKSLDLLEFTVSEIHESYSVEYWSTRRSTSPRFKRMVLAKVKIGGDYHNRILGIGCDDGMIKYRKRKHWRAKEWGKFSDIIVHKGLTYALDSRGTVWWISSRLEISIYGPPLDESITNGYSGNKSFVECCGELYIVDRLFEEENPLKRKAGSVYGHVTVGKPRTVGFKVYKFDEELGKMVEVKSLGDYAFVMATDTCFAVLAQDFYGCLKDSIYFTDDGSDIKVFKLYNCVPAVLESPQSSVQMFVPSFL